MPFTTPLQVQLLNDTSVYPWVTLEPLVYESAITGETHTVPRHFRTDGASVPRAVLLLAPHMAMRFMGQSVWKGFKQGCLHDYLRRRDRTTGKLPVPAKIAHLVFREALIDAGYPDDLVSAYYQAVRLFNS